MVTRQQVNLRLSDALAARVDRSAARQHMSRNALLTRYVEDGLALDDDTNRRVSLQPALDQPFVRKGELIGRYDPGANDEPEHIQRGRTVAQAVAIEKAGPERQSDKPHRHRFIEVEGTRSPGRLLGETEATYECVCGKSERRKVT